MLLSILQYGAMFFWSRYSIGYAIGSLLFVCIISKIAKCEISSPKEVHGVVGQEAGILLNTTNNNSLLAINFGLDGGKDYPLPKFVTVMIKNGKSREVYGEDICATGARAASYCRRIHFIGNLTMGHAWFKITNLTLSDTNVYMVKIRKASDITYKHTEKIKLIVRLPEFISFEGIAKKVLNSSRCKCKRGLLQNLVRKAYRNVSVKVYLKYKRRWSRVMIAGFHVTFTKTVNKTYASSFLEVAQRNNELGGYTITCFEPTNKLPKLINGKKGNVPPPDNSPNKLHIFFWTLGVIVIFVLIVILVILLKSSCTKVIKSRLRALIPRRDREHAVGANDVAR